MCIADIYGKALSVQLFGLSALVYVVPYVVRYVFRYLSI